MVLRSAGEIGCAHCKTIGADRSCQVCTRLVCRTCAADWATCDEPSGRVVRLGTSARVRDIDPLGRYALVSHWRQPLRIFDLRALAWVRHVAWERYLHLGNRRTPPRLTAAGRLVYADPVPASDLTFRGMRTRAIADGSEAVLAATIGTRPEHGTAVSTTGDVFHYVSEEQRVIVVPEVGHPGSYEPLPRKVVQAVCIDGERMLMASATWGEVAVHLIDDERGLIRLAHATSAEGHVTWLGIAGGWVITGISQLDTSTLYQARRLAADRTLGPVEQTYFVTGPLRVAALSRDGRFFAAPSDGKLDVYDLDADTSRPMATFDDHTDEINIVRFAREDHVLISADTDNRLILRPRNKTGYARPLLPVDIPAG